MQERVLAHGILDDCAAATSMGVLHQGVLQFSMSSCAQTSPTTDGTLIKSTDALAALHIACILDLSTVIVRNSMMVLIEDESNSFARSSICRVELEAKFRVISVASHWTGSTSRP